MHVISSMSAANKRKRHSLVYLYKILPGIETLSLFGRDAEGAQVRESIRLYETKHVFFPDADGEKVVNLVKNKLKGLKSVKRKLYMTPTERYHMFGTQEAVWCLLVNISKQCNILEQIATVTRSMGVKMYVHSEHLSPLNNTLLRSERMTEITMNTEITRNAQAKVVYLLLEGSCTTSFLAVHVNEVDTNDFSVMSISTQEGIISIDEIEQEYDIVVVCDTADKVSRLTLVLNRPLLINLQCVYDKLPKNVNGLYSHMKLSVNMHRGKEVSNLHRLLIHDMGKLTFRMNSLLITDDMPVWKLCVMYALDNARQITVKTLHDQSRTRVPLQCGTGNPGVMHNLLFLANDGVTDVLLTNTRQCAQSVLRGPKRFRYKYANVFMGEIGVADLRSAYPSMVIAHNISRESDGVTDGIMTTLMRRLISERDAYKLEMHRIGSIPFLPGDTRRRLVSRYNAMQESAKLNANSLVGILACKSCNMLDTSLADDIYRRTERVIKSITDVLSNEFATCLTCNSTHRFRYNSVKYTEPTCKDPVEGTGIRILEHITDSVIFHISPNDPIGHSKHMIADIDKQCCAHIAPVKLESQGSYSIWMFAKGMSTFALPMTDLDASKPENWLCKGPVVNPGQRSKEYVKIIRSLFAYVATLHLQNFPLTASRAEQDVILTIVDIAFTQQDLHSAMLMMESVATPEMQQIILNRYLSVCV